MKRFSWCILLAILVNTKGRIPIYVKGQAQSESSRKEDSNFFRRDLLENCVDDPPGFYDAGGRLFDCAWYAEGNRCSYFGHLNENNGRTANDACCVCNGGITKTSLPTLSPIQSQTLEPTMHPTFPPTLPSPFYLPTLYPTAGPTKPDITQSPSTKPADFTSSPSTQPSQQQGQNKTIISFFGLADSPYSVDERFCLNMALRDLDLAAADASHVIHLGDIKNRQSACNEEAYNDIAEIFIHPSNAINYDPRDCFFVPGDNEWHDCTNASEAWDRWTRNFGINNPYGFGTLSDGETVVTRQTGVLREPGVDRSENFAFFKNQVLFIGLNMVGSKELIGDESIRLAQNFEFVRDQLEVYSNGTFGMKAAVVFGHASIGNFRAQYYGQPFKTLLRQKYRNLSVLHLHGDGHVYNKGNPDPHNLNLVQVQLDSGRKAPPVLVSVIEKRDGSHEFQIDRRQGRFDGFCPMGDKEKTWLAPM